MTPLTRLAYVPSCALHVQELEVTDDGRPTDTNNVVEKWRRVRENPHSCAALLEAVKIAILDELFGFKPGDKKQSNPNCFCGVVFYVIAKVEQSGRLALHIHGAAALAAFCIERLRGLFAGPNCRALALAHSLCCMWQQAPYYNPLPGGQPNRVHGWTLEESRLRGLRPPIDDRRCPAAAYDFLTVAGATPAQHKAAAAAAAAAAAGTEQQQPLAPGLETVPPAAPPPPGAPPAAALAAAAQGPPDAAGLAPEAPQPLGAAAAPELPDAAAAATAQQAARSVLLSRPPTRRRTTTASGRVFTETPLAKGLPPLPSRERYCCQYCSKVVACSLSHSHNTTCLRHGCLGTDKDCGMIFPRILRELFRWIGEQGTFLLPRSGPMQVSATPRRGAGSGRALHCTQQPALLVALELVPLPHHPGTHPA